MVTEPYTDKDTKQLMTSVSSPLIINGKFAGIVGTDITLDTLSQQADQVSGYDNTLREYLVSYDGMLIGASGDHQQLGKKSEDDRESLRFSFRRGTQCGTGNT